jgi:hypothetical protein
MKLPALLLLTGLFFPARAPQDQEKEKEPPKKGLNAATRFFEGEAERLTKELDGSWMLLSYTDPQTPVGTDTASGFLTFHDGYLTWLVAVDAVEKTFFGRRSLLILDTGAYRYRIDEQANLQLSAILSFTNNNETGDITPDAPGLAFEYIAKIEDNVLELRDNEGIVLAFRKVEAGEFPDSAARQIEKGRSGTNSWEDLRGNR